MLDNPGATGASLTLGKVYGVDGLKTGGGGGGGAGTYPGCACASSVKAQALNATAHPTIKSQLVCSNLVVDIAVPFEPMFCRR